MKELPRIARAAISEEFGGPPLTTETLRAITAACPELEKERAAFVTLHKHGQLRGCIGSILPQRPLIEDVVHNAKAAAFNDPRFPPLAAGELEDVDIEVSVLSVPAPLPYTDVEDLRAKIRPGVDGVIIRQDGRQATFQPSVWAQLPDFDAFFSHLCQKAGLPGTCLTMHPDVYVYQAEKVEE
jgi:AmmeMemoRadiSam system protein A